MFKLHLATSQGSLHRGALRPRIVRVAFDRAPGLRGGGAARWHLAGLVLAVVASIVLWAGIAALIG